ncbi:unnamed protein product [Rhizopus stolonifer]
MFQFFFSFLLVFSSFSFVCWCLGYVFWCSSALLAVLDWFYDCLMLAGVCWCLLVFGLVIGRDILTPQLILGLTKSRGRKGSPISSKESSQTDNYLREKGKVGYH